MTKPQEQAVGSPTHFLVADGTADDPGPGPTEKLTYAIQAGGETYLWQTEQQ